MGYNFGRAFDSMFNPQMADTRTNEARTMENQQIGQTNQLQDEYAQAQANPNAGIGLSPSQQAYVEQELARSSRNNTSQAAGGSSAADNAVNKAITEYRIGQIGQRQAYLNNLRQAMITSSRGWQQPMQSSPGLGQKVVGDLAGRATAAAGRGMFGPSEEESAAQRKDAANAGSSQGGNGFRVGAPGQAGGQSGGNGVMNPWGVQQN